MSKGNPWARTFFWSIVPKIWVQGGGGDSKPTHSVECYDPQTKTGVRLIQGLRLDKREESDKSEYKYVCVDWTERNTNGQRRGRRPFIQRFDIDEQSFEHDDGKIESEGKVNGFTTYFFKIILFSCVFSFYETFNSVRTF